MATGGRQSRGVRPIDRSRPKDDKIASHSQPLMLNAVGIERVGEMIAEEGKTTRCQWQRFTTTTTLAPLMRQ